jgi:hypothetical protein
LAIDLFVLLLLIGELSFVIIHLLPDLFLLGLDVCLALLEILQSFFLGLFLDLDLFKPSIEFHLLLLKLT